MRSMASVSRWGVGLLDRRVEGEVDDHALAAHAVIGREFLAQIAVAHGQAQVALDGDVEQGVLHRVAHRGLDEELLDEGLVEGLPRAHAFGLGDPAPPQPLGEGQVRKRKHPLRRALEHVHLVARVDQLGHHLVRGGAGADHADALALQVHVVPPARGVPGRAGEAVQAGDVGHLGVVQDAGGRDHEVDHEVIALVGVHGPSACGVVPQAGRDGAAEAHPLNDAVFLRHVFKVVLELGAGGALGLPRGGLEGIAVVVRRDVAGHAGVGVVAPGAAHAVGLLDHGHVGDAGLAQADHGEHAGGASADDQHGGGALRVLCHGAACGQGVRTSGRSAARTRPGPP
jgi:hypothetical protein